MTVIALPALILQVSSCGDFLDREDDDQITEAEAFSRYERVNGMVSDVYAAAKHADRPLVFFEHFSNSAITDECEGTNVEGNITNNFNNGAWNPNSLPGSCGQYWESLYEGIRNANLIIQNVEKYNTPDNPQQDGDLRNRIGEMYFMRGYFHYLLMRMYGEAPYIDRVINAGDDMNFKQESVHTMVEKIVKDAQTAYDMVPNKYVKTSENFGRVDKGACLGLIAVSRWLVATPLWNGASQYGYTGKVRLTDGETAYFNARKFFPESIRLAVSGIALITNKQNKDSLITVSQFRDILTGKVTEWKELYPESELGKIQVVFDNPNSGTIHYAIDSICRGAELSPKLTAEKSNEAVISHVAATPNAIGVIGANWIGNSADTTRLSFNESVRVMAVSAAGKATVENSFKPYQAYLALWEYPLTHNVYILINDPRGALPTGLMTFLTSDRGQRIILKSGIVPATQPVRLVNVKDEY